MARISSSIPNLVNGVSQQPAATRLASQAEAQENCMSSVVDGLIKRPPTEHVAKLITGTLADAHLHTINRDSTERYNVIFTDDDIRVFDKTGVEKTVNFETVMATLQDGATAVGNGTSQIIYIPASASTISLVTTGITTATVVWEKSADAAFTSPTTLRTDTSDTSGTVAWAPASDNGYYVRARISAYTSGTITATISWESINYIATATPSTDLRAITVADYTFILNTKKTAVMDGVQTASRDYEAMAFVKIAANGKDYTLDVDGNSNTHPIPITGVARTRDVISGWDSALNATLVAAGFTVVAQNPIYYVHRSTDFTGYTEDDLGNTGTDFFKSQAQHFTDLPTTAPDGFELEITGDASSGFDNYYVKFSTNDGSTGIAEGTWAETVKQGIAYKFDALTMPHLLVREADGTFTFKRAAWGNRTVGDTTTAPDPSFISGTINDIFLFKNRLGFLSGQNVIMSRAGEFFEFFPKTVTDVLASGPVDVAATTKGVSVLYHAVPFDKSLMLFSDQAQFILTGGEILAADTVSIDLVTEFTADVVAPPVGVGDDVFSPTFRGDWTSINDYRVLSNSDVPEHVEVTAHVPHYIPGNVFKMAGAANENMLVVASRDDTDALYVHTYYWAGAEKLQSSWSRWTFAGATILNVDFLDSYLYLLVQHSDAVYLERILVTPGALDADATYLTHLDRKVNELTSGVSSSYDSGTDKTTWTLPYTLNTSATCRVVTRMKTGSSVTPAIPLQGIEVSGATIKANGDHTTDPVFIGEEYEARYQFSTPVLKQKSKDGSVAVAEGRLQILRWSLTYANSGTFDVVVTPAHSGVASTHTYTGRTTGAYTIGSVPIEESGVFQVPILANAKDTKVEIKSASFLPFSFQEAEWLANYVPKSQRV